MVERTTADFAETLKAAGDTPVIVDFYADWCGPCRMLSPILAKAVADNKKTFVVKLNVDESPEVAQQYQIMSLPTVAAIKNGKVVDSFVGLRNEAAVKAFLDSATK
ncbi:thioredoxin-like protein [Zopfochytrium polystomum]|nr:thioredoxin-like protein [Zopfochytrium polystomum]